VGERGSRVQGQCQSRDGSDEGEAGVQAHEVNLQMGDGWWTPARSDVWVGGCVRW
jgi:hypothetical protein